MIAIAKRSLLRSINALTLCTADMKRSCAFYESLGLATTFGGPESDFTTFSATGPPVTPSNNALHINLVHAPGYEPPPSRPGVAGGWGRAVIYVDDVDEMYGVVGSAGFKAREPRDAPWGERCFHLMDPDGHELSFATPDYDHPRWSQGSSLDALMDANAQLRKEKRNLGSP